MTGHRVSLGVAMVLLTALTVGTVGAAMPATGGMDAGETADSGASEGRTGASGAIAGPATANHSAIDTVAAAEEPWQNFTRANRSLANASAELDAISANISTDQPYSNSDHAAAERTLREMDNQTRAMNRAANESIRAVNNSNATPAQKFMAYQAIASHRSAGERRATRAVETYEAAVGENRAATQSTVTVRFGGGLFGGLLIGAALGAIVPFREARNVEEQLKLSRNVSYNRRTALLPIVVGVVLLVAGIGVLYFVGGIDLLGVIV